MKPERVLIIAGETSGDIHGAGVVRELKKRVPSAEIFGIGGSRMEKEGMMLAYHIREISFMGFAEVISHIPLIRSIERTLESLLKLKKPDLVVLIDYPGFNLRFARTAKAYGCKVLFYISPQVWAWKRGRVKKMRGIIDRMCVVFPFEEKIYRENNIPVTFVGHPLLEELESGGTREEFCSRFQLDPGKKILALIPGSRKQEIRLLLSVMARAAESLRRDIPIEIAVACAPDIQAPFYMEHLPPGVTVKFIHGQTHSLMKFAAAAIVTSGTATLETACFGTPMVIVYRTSWLTYLIGRLVIRIPMIGLANIVAGKKIVPELIQHEATVANIVQIVSDLLTDGNERSAMVQELLSVRSKLGKPGASNNVVDAILELAASAVK